MKASSTAAPTFDARELVGHLPGCQNIHGRIARGEIPATPSAAAPGQHRVSCATIRLVWPSLAERFFAMKTATGRHPAVESWLRRNPTPER